MQVFLNSCMNSQSFASLLFHFSSPLLVASDVSMATVRVLEDKFIERVNGEEASFSEGTDRLNEDQLESVCLCCELFRADMMKSLKEVSVSQQYRLLRARKLLQQIFSDLERLTKFLLCMLPWSITNPTKLDQRKFLSKLQTWCENPGKERTTKNCEDRW
ncbi:hypothetical protein AJ78_04395 [Emergomyces pasteurianus Ep9510]|uniref:Uncharacterized protein n=1 Tax=Emergomyces pasteurianus Ep9510 TaxID=1447872 RepID=A0A1J9PH67_9EURO|nr:hypothetical protein AJ78_04395 [Emergomyces pasteurianus Ep9510]